jgi:hypothetical protein
MKRTTTLAALTAAVVLGGGAVGATAAIGGDASPTASAAAGPKVHEVDADLTRSGKLRLEAETAAAARRVSFTYAGRTVPGRLVDVDDDDRTREWAATVAPAQRDRAGGHRVALRVRACAADCTERTLRPFVEPHDADEDDD